MQKKFFRRSSAVFFTAMKKRIDKMASMDYTILAT